MHPIIQRLKDRKLVQWAVAYVVGAFALYQGLDAFAGAWFVTAAQLRVVQLALLVGFFVTLVLAWYHGERGEQHVTGAELVMITCLLAIGLLLLRTLPGAGRLEPRGTFEALPLLLHPDQKPTGHLAMSRDGKRYAFSIDDADGSQIWAGRIGDSDFAPIPGSRAGEWPTFSPDGSRLAFLTGNTVTVASLADGLTRPLAAATAICCLRWADDGHLYYTEAVTLRGLRIRADGSNAPEVVLDRTTQEFGIGPIEVHPDGDIAVFHRLDGRIEVTRLDGASPAHVVDGRSPRFTESGDLLYVSQDNVLTLAEFDFRTLQIGEPRPVAQVGVVRGGGVLNAAAYASSDSGDLLFWPPTTPEVEVVQVGPAGALSTIGWSFNAPVREFDESRDGRYLVVRARVGSDQNLWIRDAETGRRWAATSGAGAESAPRWLSGDTLVYRARRGGAPGMFDLFVQAAADGAPTLFYSGARSVTEYDVGPDPRWLAVRTAGGGGANVPIGQRDIFIVDRVSGEESPFAADSVWRETEPRISPDGQRMAYVLDRGEGGEVRVKPFPRARVDALGTFVAMGGEPRWSPDGSRLYFVDSEGGLQFVEVPRGGDLGTARPVEVSLPEGVSPRPYQVLDAGRLLLLREINTVEPLWLWRGWAGR